MYQRSYHQRVADAPGLQNSVLTLYCIAIARLLVMKLPLYQCAFPDSFLSLDNLFSGPDESISHTRSSSCTDNSIGTVDEVRNDNDNNNPIAPNQDTHGFEKESEERGIRMNKIKVSISRTRARKEEMWEELASFGVSLPPQERIGRHRCARRNSVI